MIKTIDPTGWDFDRPIALPVKVSRNGLTGQDKKEFLKVASEKFIPVFEQVKFAGDEYPVHLIAMGSSDFYGSNRNGDGFKCAMLKRCHPSFVKHAKFFRNHKNKPERGDPWYGTVKASVFNEKMQRVELLCSLNMDEKSASRNKGLVADREIEKLAAGKDIGVSMAIRVPYDVCSYCGNQAKTPRDYCTSEKCAAGGCRDNLSKLVKVGSDLHLLHVDNPDGTFFDISHVFRPADRIAYGATADYLTKSASVQEAIASVPLSVLSEMSDEGWNNQKDEMAKLGYAMAILESNNDPLFQTVTNIGFPVEKLAEFGTKESVAQLSALA